MKLREFNKLINACRNKKKTRLDMNKVRNLPLEQRQAMGQVIVRHREPLLVEFAEGLDRSWLACMGYLYQTTSPSCPEFTFYHTGEHRIR